MNEKKASVAWEAFETLMAESMSTLKSYPYLDGESRAMLDKTSRAFDLMGIYFISIARTLDEQSEMISNIWGKLN